MLTIIRSRREVRRITVYDLEWIPRTLQLRVAGVYDERGYRCYFTMEDFLNAELSSDNRGRWFYAHAGGLADVQFVLEQAVNSHRYQVRASFSGSSAIICRIKQGKNNWTFVDSYWLLRDKLEEIAKWIGLEKGEKEAREQDAEEWYTNVDIQTLIRYNQSDCIILYNAIKEMQNTLLGMGGQLQMTLASSAMNLFRRKFLSNEIDTNKAINEKARLAYFASRVEVFRKKVDHGYYYDINSSFPFAMTKACPGRVLDIGRAIPDYGIYMADVEIEVPEDYLPPIPTRMENRLFFPTGRWRTWLMSTDIELLLKNGGRLLKSHEVITFAPFYNLSDYAKTLYEKRKKSDNPFEKTAYKLLLNSLYGKFAESPNKTSLLIDPDEITTSMDMLFPGAFLEEKLVKIPHMHVPISAHITAVARKTLFDYITCCSNFHYCDTDGFSTTEKLQTGNELGRLKLEKILQSGWRENERGEQEWVDGAMFLAPKVYRINGTDEKGEPIHLLKAKGFSGMTLGKWERLERGLEVDVIRMMRLRELYRRGKTRPVEKLMLKRIKQDSFSKRFVYPDGHTRPWRVSELEKQFKKRPGI